MGVEDKPKKRTPEEKKKVGMIDPLADLTASSIKKPGLKDIGSGGAGTTDVYLTSKGKRSPYNEMSGKTGTYQYRPHGEGGYEVLKDQNIKFYAADSVGAKQVRGDERRWKESSRQENKLMSSVIKDPNITGIWARQRKIKEDENLIAKGKTNIGE